MAAAISKSIKDHVRAIEPAELAPEGGKYMFLKVPSEKSNSDYLALTVSHEDENGMNSICLAEWKCGSYHEQSFKVEQCSDYHEDYVVSCYENKDNLLQWMKGENSSLELLSYSTSREERLRPKLEKWRFRFEKCTDSNMYRILSKDVDQGNIFLALEDTVGESLSELKFKPIKDDDQDLTQLWQLYLG